MKYLFPVIKTINDVLPYIKDKEEIIVAERDHFDIINYVVSKEDTFLDENIETAAMLRECRGIVFDKSGKIISRRLHKFFNINEKEETQSSKIDLTQPHIVLDKLDGSMITPIITPDGFRLGTRMGITDVAIQAENFISENPKYVEFFGICQDMDITPIFEWCSQKQRIVLKYDEDNLILTAIRHNITGQYFKYQLMKEFGQKNNIPVVKAYESVKDINEFIEKTKSMIDIEGFIIRFDDGHMLKLKCDDYVMKHRSNDAVQNARHIVQSILDNTIDDLKAHVLPEQLNKIKNIEIELWQKIYSICDKLKFDFDLAYKNSNGDRKTFAIKDSKNYDPFTRGAIYYQWDNKNVLDYVINYVKDNSTKDIKFKELITYFVLSQDLFNVGY